MAKKSKPIKTLAKNVKTAAKGVTKVKKVVTRKSREFERLESKRSYKFRDLPIAKHKSVKAYAQELEKHPELDQLKKPGEMWAFTIYGHNSHQIFETIDLAAGYLATYNRLEKVDIDRVRFLKFGEPGKKLTERQYQKVVGEYQAAREKKVKAHRKRREKVEKATQEAVTKLTGKKPATNLDAMEALLNLNKSLTARLDKLEKMLAGKPAKKSAKKVAKKSAPSKGGKKSAPPKGGKKSAPSKGGKKNAASKQSKSGPKVGKAKKSTGQKAAKKATSKKTATPKGKKASHTGKAKKGGKRK